MNSENLSSFLGIKDLKQHHVIIRQMFAEFLGTYLYLALVLFADTILGPGPTGSALSHGLLIASIIMFIGHISGGHMNPAITIGVMVNNQISVMRSLCYIVAQILGSIAGSATTYGLTTASIRASLGITVPYPTLGVEQVFGIELLMTFILVAVVLSVIDPNRGFSGVGSGSFAIGLSVTACQCSCLPYTGSLNPVRSLGPAVIMNSWKHHWVYWVGPISGGIAAGLTYRFVLRPNWSAEQVLE